MTSRDWMEVAVWTAGIGALVYVAWRTRPHHDDRRPDWHTRHHE